MTIKDLKLCMKKIIVKFKEEPLVFILTLGFYELIAYLLIFCLVVIILGIG